VKQAKQEVVMSIRIDKSLRDEVEKIAEEESRTLGGQVRKVLKDFVEKRAKK
jgi:hypothetical protein